MSVYREPDGPNPSSTSPTHHMSSSSSRSQMLGASTTRSQPFLNMLNPIGNGRRYAGYAQARQDVVPEEPDGTLDDDDEGENTERETIPLASTSQARSTSKPRRGAGATEIRPNIHSKATGGDALDSSDDEVPQSFMIETHTRPRTPKSRGKDRARTSSSRPSHSHKDKNQRPILPVGAELPGNLSIPPRPSEISSPGHDPFDDDPMDEAGLASTAPQRPQMRGLDAYERALWNWVNVYNLDAFLQEVYFYYEGKGIYCIALARVLNLLTVGFVIGFSTFLLGCVDYSRIKHERVTLLSEVVVSRCVSKFSGFTLIFFLLFSAFYLWQIVTFVFAIRRLVDMYHFYTHLLRIPDADIQTISWPEVVRRISAIREENPLTALSSASAPAGNTATAKLDAHDVANRIMRQENYLIALFNKELLDLRVPLPPALSAWLGGTEEGKGRTLTKALEWNLRFCLMEYLFDPNGKVRKVFLKSKNRNALVEGLRRRFIFMGILNALFAPFIVLYLLMYSFFRYFEEYHKNPSSIGSRRYTLFAQWKFREFNELPHLFARRLDESYPTANIYIAQFPNEKLALLMRFVSFVAGSFAAVLLLASVLDPDLFLHFEITPHRTVLFYLGLFGSVLAGARGMVPDEHRVFDPQELMSDIIQYTHYLPATWSDALHSKRVHAEFGEMFVMKIAIYAGELLSVVLTPFVLWWSLPGCAPEIVDFFREFTVHVDGLGYVCSFAVFDFQRHGNVKFGAPTKVEERLTSKEGKMEKSFLNFKAAHPEWTPSDPSGSLYLSRMADYRSTTQPTSFTPHRHRRRPSHDLDPDHQGGRREKEVRIDTSGKDKAREYEAALAQSQAVARKRRGPAGLGASTMLNHPGGGMMESTMMGSTMQAGMAQTAVLGDSLGPSVIASPPRGVPATLKAISAEDRTPDEGVGSGLGESYVDGARPARVEGPSVGGSRVEEEEGLEDGGVLGLLAQIYGTGARGQGPARVIN